MEGYSLSAVFQQYIETENVSNILRKIAELVASEKLSRKTFNDLVSEEGFSNSEQLRELLLDQILYYANACVQDHELSEDEKKNLWILTTVFQIKDGDFLKFRKKHVQIIFETQIKQMIQDRSVSDADEILLSDLQRVFGLGYDDYVSLVKPTVRSYIMELEARKQHYQIVEDIQHLDRYIQDLRSIFLISN
jgi:hypothetical protein